MTPPVRWLALALFLAGAAPAPAPAQDWLLLNGIADGEAWVTDSASTLLSRNAGQFATLGRVQLFAAAAVRPTLQLIFMGEIEGGDATDADNELAIGYDQLVLRYIPSPRAVIDVGKFPSPVGAFANRRLSTTNPLIGSPDGYAVTYPWGIEVSGAISHFDYRAALVSLPVTHEGYVPDPSPALRPALGGGYTPVPELRLGASLTWGPYLNSDLSAALPAGADWKTYIQRVLGIDSRLTIGYFEFRAEVLLSRYDVPTRSSALEAVDVYAEAKQTWAPRLFTAARFERNDYALVVPDSAGPWSGRLVDSYNGEVGVGYRLSAGTTLKASYRRAWWRVASDLRPGMPDGYAFGLQLSCHGDINGWFERKR